MHGLAVLASLGTALGESAVARELQGCEQTDKVTLQLKWLVQAQFMGYLAGREIGGPFGNIYKKNCVLCPVRAGDPLIDPAVEILDGFSDVGVVAGSSFLAHVANGEPLTCVGALHHSNGMVLVAFKDFCGRDDGSCTLADLQGKTVGLSRDAMVPVKKLFSDNGIEATIVPKFFGVAQLLDGTWEAAGLMQFNEVGLVLQSVNPKTGYLYTMDDLLIWDGLSPTVDEVLVVRNDILEQKAPQIQRFLAAQAKAWHYCKHHEEECVAMLPNPDQAQQRFMLREIHRMMYPKPEGFGHYSEDKYWVNAQTLLEAGAISELPATFAVNNSLMDAAVAELKQDPEYADIDGLEWDEPVLEFCARKGEALRSICTGFEATACRAGFAPVGHGECAPCPAGTYAPLEDKGNVCELCPPGESSEAGSAECTPCSEGHFAAEAGGLCQQCPPGEYADTFGSSSCTLCPAGSQSAEAGAAACSVCPRGTYAAVPGTPECSLCSDVFADSTTLVAGARHATDCTCAQGKFWNRRDDECADCPPGSFCPGGLLLPVVYSGTYGDYVGGVEDDEALVAAKMSGEYKGGRGFYELAVYSCASDALCPGGAEVFEVGYGASPEARKEVRLPPNQGAACAEHRESLACARCTDGWYGTVECLECDGAGLGGGVALMVVFPAFMVVAYRLTANQSTQRVQTAFIFVATFGIFAFFMQTVAVLDTLSLNWPASMDWLFEFGRLILFDLSGVSFSCMTGQRFATQYWTSILIPMYLVFSAAVGLGVTNVLPVPEGWKMEFNKTFSLLGMIFTALYITLVKIVMAYFECVENPAAEQTLAKFRDVICGTAEHTAALPAMGIGLLLYVVGFYLAFAKAAYEAPQHWMDVGFRERWKFMLTRWRPAVFYWGCCMMTRNLLVAFAGVVSTEPRAQLVYIVTVVVAASVFTAVWQPWRERVLNHYDVGTSVVLCLIGVFGIVFVSLQDEMRTNARFGLEAAVRSQQGLYDSFGSGLLVLISVLCMSFGALLIWCVAMLMPSAMARNVQKQDAICKALASKLDAALGSPNFREQAARVIFESTGYDRSGLENFLDQVAADQKTPMSGTTDSISIKKAKTAQSGGAPRPMVPENSLLGVKAPEKKPSPYASSSDATSGQAADPPALVSA